MSSKKKLKLGQIDVDFQQFALVINYTTEMHHFDSEGNPLKVDREPGQKLVRIPRGLQGGELQDLAFEDGHARQMYHSRWDTIVGQRHHLHPVFTWLPTESLASSHSCVGKLAVQRLEARS